MIQRPTLQKACGLSDIKAQLQIQSARAQLWRPTLAEAGPGLMQDSRSRPLTLTESEMCFSCLFPIQTKMKRHWLYGKRAPGDAGTCFVPFFESPNTFYCVPFRLVSCEFENANAHPLKAP